MVLISGDRHLAIRLVVHDDPPALFLERQIDDAFDERAVFERQRDRRFAPAGPARVRAPRADQQIVLQDSCGDTCRVRPKPALQGVSPQKLRRKSKLRPFCRIRRFEQ